MAQDYFQEITPTASGEQRMRPERSIRNIQSSGRNGGGQVPPVRPKRPRASRGGGKRLLMWGGVLVALLVLGFAGATLFLKTTVTVTPRTHTVVFDSTITYTANPQGDTAAAGSLTYTTETQTLSDSIDVAASGSEEVKTGASGTITIYNNYSTTPFKLIKNTRFETPDGKIFHIIDPVSIPGKSGDTPGSLLATVYANEVGADYNIGPVAKFTLPGLANTPDIFKAIYASSDASMSGGFVGSRPKVAGADLTAAEAQLKQRIEKKVQEAYADNASAYALIPYALITYAAASIEEQSGGARVTLTATASVPVIARASLDAFLAAETSALSGSSAIKIEDPSTFSITTKDSAQADLSKDPLDFSLSGKATFTWDIDSAALAQDLAGKSQSAFDTIVGSYPSIDSATARVYPLWSRGFPTDASKIEIKVAKDQK